MGINCTPSSAYGDFKAVPTCNLASMLPPFLLMVLVVCWTQSCFGQKSGDMSAEEVETERQDQVSNLIVAIVKTNIAPNVLLSNVEYPPFIDHDNFAEKLAVRGFVSEARDYMTANKPSPGAAKVVAELIVSEQLNSNDLQGALETIRWFSSVYGADEDLAGWNARTKEKVIRWTCSVGRLDVALQILGEVKSDIRTFKAGRVAILKRQVELASPDAAVTLLESWRKDTDEATFQELQYQLLLACVRNGHWDWMQYRMGEHENNALLWHAMFEHASLQNDYPAAWGAARQYFELNPVRGAESLATAANYLLDPSKIEFAINGIQSEQIYRNSKILSSLLAALLRTGELEKALKLYSGAAKSKHQTIPSDLVFDEFFVVFEKRLLQKGATKATGYMRQLHPKFARTRLRSELAKRLAKNNSSDEGKEARQLLVHAIVRDLFQLLPRAIRAQMDPELGMLLIHEGYVEQAIKLLEIDPPRGENDLARQRCVFQVAEHILRNEGVDQAIEFLGDSPKMWRLDQAAIQLVIEIANKKGAAEAEAIASRFMEGHSCHAELLTALYEQGRIDLAKSWLQAIRERDEGEPVIVSNVISELFDSFRIARMSNSELREWEAVLGAGQSDLSSVVLAWACRGNSEHVIHLLENDEAARSRLGFSVLQLLIEFGSFEEVKAFALKNNDTNQTNWIPVAEIRHFLLTGETNRAIERVLRMPSDRNKVFLLFDCLDHLNSPWMESLRQIDNWLESVAYYEDGHIRYPVSSEQPAISRDNLYSGMAGIAMFYSKMADVTGERRFRFKCQRIINSLEAQLENIAIGSQPGLFTGYTGIGWAINNSQYNISNPQSLLKIVDVLEESAIELETAEGRRAVTWNNVNDVISGSAGIGSWLLKFQEEHPKRIPLLMAAGEGLLESAMKVDLSDGQVGMRWLMSKVNETEMPNYSHGTAGVCAFLLELDEFCHKIGKERSQPYWDGRYDGRFAKAAQAGMRYLESINEKHGGGWLLPHHFPGGEDLRYAGWCHGPVGTCQLASVLNDIKSTEFEEGKQWQQYANRATEELLKLNLPENRTEGFWDNVGLCCGSAGVGSFLVDQAKTENKPEYMLEANRIALDILQRANNGSDKDGRPTLYWPSAEHRVRPDSRQAQTGLMQGAAGVGMFLLQLEAEHRNRAEFSIFGDVLR